MPDIAIVKGIKMHIYNGEHNPPHIHVIYNEYEALLEIESETIYAGTLPVKQLRYALRWLKENKSWALDVFYELNPNLR